LGEPSLRPNEVHLEAAMRYVRAHGIKYSVNAGDATLRELIAQHYGYPNLTGVRNVCVTTGSQEATYVTIKALLDPAQEEMLVVEPAFPSYAKMATLEGIRVKTVAMDEGQDFAYDAARILDAVNERTKLIVICSPCNPTARVMTADSAHDLAKGLLARRGGPVWILHDEIYREQTFVDRPAHIANAYPYTLVTNSLSKSNALTGLRLGWVIAPEDAIEAIVKVHAWVTSCADSFAQRVALSIFQTPGGVREHAEWYSQRQRDVITALKASDLSYITPEGSFYACVRLPVGTRSLAAANTLAEQYDVITIPGVAFGPSFDSWLRLSWVTSMDAVIEGLRRIAEFCAAIRQGSEASPDRSTPSVRS
jgi:aspartate aminotransferase